MNQRQRFVVAGGHRSESDPRLTPADERSLIERAAAGDDAAFLRLVECHRVAVFNVAFLALHDRILAEEVMQDAFVRLFQSLRRFRHEATLSTWLHRVTINLCHDVGRRKARALRALPLEEVVRLADPIERSPDNLAMRRARERAVRRAVARLPDELRAVVSLRYGGGLGYAEIARALRWPLGTVCTRLHRALKLLGRELGERPTEQAP